MSNTWVISDTHFGHVNILNFRDSNTGKYVRPDFSDVTEMNEVMIQRWNQVVRPNDVIYHLGDVFMGDKESFKKIWDRLQGRKRLIVGNHDDIPYLVKGGFFERVYMWKTFNEQRLLMSHVPLQWQSLEMGAPGSGKFFLNVHGHIHQNESPDGLYFNVSVENIGYHPISLESLQKIADKKLEEFYESRSVY